MIKLKKKFKYWRFIVTPPTLTSKCEFLESPSLLLMTIAFNEASFIEQQILLVKKYIKDSFQHIIIDNSTDLSIRKLNHAICQLHGVGYAGVPLSNPYSGNKSHGAAIHWAYYQLARKSDFRFVGFLDHDIFPLAPYSIVDKLGCGIYGRTMHAYSPSKYMEEISPEVPYWSLWAGFFFFEKNLIKGGYPWSFNFFSKHFPKGYFLDTGGGLWDKLYSQFPYPGKLATYELKQISNQEEGIQNQSFEILDNSWIHFVSLSNWRKINNLEKKKEKLQKILSSHLI